MQKLYNSVSNSNNTASINSEAVCTVHAVVLSKRFLIHALFPVVCKSNLEYARSPPNHTDIV